MLLPTANLHVFLSLHCITVLFCDACSAATPIAAAGTQQSVTKHQPAMEMDCHRICNLDANRPFTGLQDAVERVLPFHVSCTHDLLPHAPPQTHPPGWQVYPCSRHFDMTNAETRTRRRCGACRFSALQMPARPTRSRLQRRTCS